MSGRSPEIANRFIKLADENEQKLTHMQLQKLVYIAHGWNLAINASPLTHDDPEAWDYGPVYRSLYEALRSYRKAPVTALIRDLDWQFFPEEPDGSSLGDLSQNEEAVLNRVYETYGSFQAFRLSALTHQQGTPWDRVYNGGSGANGTIGAELIRGHFLELAERRKQRSA